MKDIIIGAIHNYSIPNIKNWVGSIKSCSFDGTKIIIFYDDKLDNNTIDYLNQNNFIIYKGFLPPGSMVHNQRFFDIYEILKRPQYSQHRSVICTDVRDVIFQYNPSEWITNNNVPKLTFGSELVHYKTEDWGIQNVLDGYKETGLDRVFENEIYNVGVINGRLQPFIDFCWILYWFSRGAHHNISDQSGLNMLLSTSFFEDVHLSADKTAWAAQLGTTLDPKTSRYWPLLTDTAPQVIDDMVVNSKHEPYCIAHQYDRIPFLKPIIDKKYE